MPERGRCSGRQRDIHRCVLHRRSAPARRDAHGDGARPRPDRRVPAFGVSAPDRDRARGWSRRRMGCVMAEFSYDVPDAVQELLDRSHRLGADPTITNYAGGNASAKAQVIDPASGEKIDVMWVKGSGGDLGTLRFGGLAALRLDAMRALKNVYRAPEFEDEMVAAFDYCLFGKGGAAPSIDTAMHGLVNCQHVDHLHPDSGIALATSADGEALTRTIFGDAVLWTPWRRPGFQLGLEI